MPSSREGGLLITHGELAQPRSNGHFLRHRHFINSKHSPGLSDPATATGLRAAVYFDCEVIDVKVIAVRTTIVALKTMVRRVDISSRIARQSAARFHKKGSVPFEN